MRGIKSNEMIVACIPLGSPEVDKVAVEIGFNEKLSAGEVVLPKVIGSTTKFNAQGKEIPLKDKPMETAYRQKEWKWTEFRGRYNSEEQSKIVENPYKRYPRKYITPPAVELSIVANTKGERLIAAKPIAYTPDNEAQILHILNIFLEIFGACEVRSQNLEEIITAPITRLNWTILPKGKLPWRELKSLVESVISSLPRGNRAVIDKRFETINAHEPEFVAIGRAGFSGYVVFGFPERDLYILESTKTNNATYILEDNWEHLSNLTKAEILDKNLHKERILHRENWFLEMTRVLSR